jgi:membrane fusion protein, multidrug efflux system
MMKKKWVPVLAILGLMGVAGAAWWYQKPAVSSDGGKAAATTQASGASAVPGGSGAGGSTGGPPRAPGVEVAKVSTQKLVDETQAVGQLRSRQGVMLRPEVSGRVTQILFQDGQAVRKGELLVQLDDQLQLAQLQQAQAELGIAETNHKRNVELVSQNFISKRSVDESAANVEVAKAKLALAKAQVQRLKVVAPFDGVAGLRSINVGDYIKDGTDMVNIEDMQALLLDYRLPERLQRKLKPGQKSRLQVEALPGQSFDALVQAVDPLIDANGRSVGVRACVDNRQMQLRPGMFAKVNAVFGARDDALVIPEEAVVQQGPRQFVIRLLPGEKEDAPVSQRVEVKLGLRLPGKVEVLDGLNEGDTVVVAGQQRVQKDGTVVRVVDLSRPRGGNPAQAGATGAAAPSGAPTPAGGASAAAAGDASATARAAPAGGGGGKPAAGQGMARKKPDAAGNPCVQRMSDAAR